MVDTFTRLGREHPPGIPWTPPGQTRANTHTNWSYPPVYPSSTSVSASNCIAPPHPMATFGRPVVAQFGRPIAPAVPAFAHAAEFKHPSQVAAASRTTCAFQPLPKVPIIPASVSSSSGPPPKTASRVTPLLDLTSTLRMSQVPSGLTKRAVYAHARPAATSGFDSVGRTTVNRPGSSITSVSKPRSQILRPGGKCSVLTPTAGLPSRPPPDKEPPSAPLPKAVTSHTAPPPQTTAVHAPETIALPQNGSLKRRLGMAARTGGGYSNKKFKPPTK